MNVTLIFGLDQYQQVWDAYLDGLEQRAKAGGSFDGLASVASFFVSRVDTACDKLFDEKVNSGSDAEKALAKSLLGTVAIANAKLAYQMYEAAIATPRWKALAAKGANPQRLLWASTGTKDKRYSDTMYLDELIGPDTVNTVPPATLDAFRDHGKPAATLQTGVDEARARIAKLPELGVDLGRVCRGPARGRREVVLGVDEHADVGDRRAPRRHRRAPVGAADDGAGRRRPARRSTPRSPSLARPSSPSGCGTRTRPRSRPIPRTKSPFAAASGGCARRRTCARRPPS